MEETQKPSKNNMMMPGLFVIAALILIAAGVIFYNSNKATTMTTANTNPSPAVTTESTTSATTNTYKDGTYSVVGDYVSPGGPEQLGVTITLTNGVVSNAEVEPKATLAMSQKYQGMFVADFKPQVIGKNINDIKLTKVSGSSLAPKGFNDALEKVKTEAKS